MRVCARLSAVQRLKQHKEEDDAQQQQQRKNGRQQGQTGRKRASRSIGGKQVPEDADLWHHATLAVRTRRTVKPMAAEWQQRQQQGIVQASHFDWDQYLAVRGGTAAVNGHLFQHQHFLERTLAQHIFRPGRSVRVQCTQNGERGQWVAGRIGVTLPFGQAVVEFPMRTVATEHPVRNGRVLGMDTSAGGVRTEIVSLHKVQLADPNNHEDSNRGSAVGPVTTFAAAVDKDFRAILRDHREWLGRQLHTFIQEGQLFELQEVQSFPNKTSLKNEPVSLTASSDPATTSSSTPNNNNSSSNPQRVHNVHTVRIVGHRHGLMLVEQIGGAGRAKEQDGQQPRRELVHITSERCHPLGWTSAQHPSDNYSLIGGHVADWEDTAPPAVPRWLFTFRPLAAHKFEVGMLLEMLDPLTWLSFVPAYVSERVNRHYFKVRPIRDIQCLHALLHTPDHLVHCASPDIFPVGWCFKNQIRLTFPQGMHQTNASCSYAVLRLKLHDLIAKRSDNNGDNNRSAFDVDASAPPPSSTQAHGVQAVLHEQGQQQQPSSSSVPPASLSSFCCFAAALPSSSSSSVIGMEFNFAPDSLFDLPKMVQKRLECVRYCEVQDADDPSLFRPGAIVRSHQHLVWVHVDHDAQTNRPAQIYTVNSSQLFRCGTAKRASSSSFGTLFPPNAALRYFTVPIRIPTALSSCGHFLLRSFTSQRTPLFLARPKQFLSDMWLKADLWLPAIHLSANCFCGPFLAGDKVCALPTRYAPSPLPHAIGMLVKDLLACGNGGFGTRGVRELVDLVGADRTSRAPLQMLLKLKYANRRVRFSVETCERAAQFPGWLRTLLIRLDACPNLLSLEKLDKCPLNCSTNLGASPYLSCCGHANTASQQSSQQQTNKLNQAAQKLRKVVQQQQRKKQQNNGRAKRVKKSEEEGEEEYASQHAQPLPTRREPSKRLSIAQPVVDDDFDEDKGEGEEEDGEEGDGIGGLRREERRRRRRSSRRSSGHRGDAAVFVDTVTNKDNNNNKDIIDDDEDDENNSKSAASTTTNSQRTTTTSTTTTADDVVDEPKPVQHQQQQRRRGNRNSNNSSSTDTDESSWSLSSSSSSTSSARSSASVVTAPQTPTPPSLASAHGQQTAKHQQRQKHDEDRPASQHHQQQPMVTQQQHQQQQQQLDVKREEQRAMSEDDVQWFDGQPPQQYQQPTATTHPTTSSHQQQQKNICQSAPNSSEMAQRYQHYTAPPPMPFFAPYLYAPTAGPPQHCAPYAYFFAPFAPPPPSATVSASFCAPSSSSSSSPSPSAPPFLHHPPPPSHFHLMPSQPMTSAMFAPLAPTAAPSVAGTSVTSQNSANYNDGGGVGGGTSGCNFVCPPVDSNPVHWSADTLCQWLTAAGFVDSAQRLLNEEVDGASLLLFSPIHYQNLGLKLGPMVKLQQMVEYLRQFTDVRCSKQ